MIFKKILFFFLFATVLIHSLQAQRRRRSNLNDTITSNYQPSELFAPMFYSEKGNEFHSANGEPGPKYWQNRADYQLKAQLDTVAQNT